MALLCPHCQSEVVPNDVRGDVVCPSCGGTLPFAGAGPSTSLPEDASGRAGARVDDSDNHLATTVDQGTGRHFSDETGELSATGDWPSIPGYQILEELGRGGMGVVYKARHEPLRRVVALKMIRAGGQASPGDRNRFRSEAEAVASLQHPNIVQIYEIGEAAGNPFIALEYVAGGSLAGKLAGQPLSPRESAELVRTLAGAMQAAHARGVVHRDLKPANVLLTPDGAPKVTDFGLAKQLAEPSSQTQTGTILGTPSYMAPEQAEGRIHAIDPTTDVYALGAILYECLTGRPPFRGASVLETLEQVRRQEPVPVSQLQMNVPRDLETVCLKCLHKQQGKRYESAGELADDLRRFLAGEPIRARPVGLWERAWRWGRRHPTAAALAGVLTLAVVAAFTGILWHNRRLGRALASEERQRQEAERQTQIAREKEQLRRRHQYAAEMNLALNAFQDGQTDLVLELLGQQIPREGEEDLRDFDWRYLWAACHAYQRALTGHTRAVGRLAVAPDGRTLASVSGFGEREGIGELFLWDLPSGELRHKFTIGQPLRAVAFSPDGTVLVSLDQSGVLRVHDPAAAREIRSWKVGSIGTGALAFTPDGREIVTYSMKGGRAGIQFWDVAGGREGRFFPATGVKGLAFSPDGRTLFYLSGVSNVHRIDLRSNRTPDVLKGTPRSAATCLAVSPGGEHLAVGHVDGHAQVWNLQANTTRTWKPHASGVGDVAFSGDSRRLITTGDDKEIRVWRLDRTQPEAVVRGHTGGIYSAVLTADGKTLITGGGPSRAGEVKVWDFPPRPDWVHLPHGKPIQLLEAAFLADGGGLVTHSLNDASTEVRHWDPSTGNLVQTVPFVDARHGTCLAGSSGEPFLLAVGSTEGDIFLHRPARSPTRVKAHTGSVSALAISPNGTQLASAAEGELKLWEITTGRLLDELPLRARVAKLCFSPDGNLLAIGGDSGKLTLWDLAGRKAVWAREAHTRSILSLSFSHTGSFLASGGVDALAQVWDVKSGANRLRLTRHVKPVRALVFSPAEKTLITGDTSGRIKVWDLVTGQDRATYTGAGTNILALSFTPDGKTLLAAGANHVLQQWTTIPRCPPP